MAADDPPFVMMPALKVHYPDDSVGRLAFRVYHLLDRLPTGGDLGLGLILGFS